MTLLSIAEVAARLGISGRAVYGKINRLKARGITIGVKVGGTTILHESDVELLRVDQRKASTAPRA